MKRFGIAVLGCFLMLVMVWCGSAAAVSSQEVKIPYVISGDGWWTGLAITNESGDAIDDMLMSFTTASGQSGKKVPPFKPHLGIASDDAGGVKNVFIPYLKQLDEIAPHAILIGTVDSLFGGDGGSLPSSAGSVILSSESGSKFSVTVYIGNATGFAYQVFHSQ
jgi:hypothetical protein